MTRVKTRNLPNRREVLQWAAAAAGTLAVPRMTRADEFPNRPVNVIIPHAAGGYGDRLARATQPFLQRELGQPLVIHNRPGAGALLGMTYFSRMPDDGYAMLCGSVAPYVPTSVLLRNAPYAVDDFWMINLPSRDYTLAATRVDSRIESWAEVVAALKADPRALSIGTQPGSCDLLNFLLAVQAEGIDRRRLRIVTYDGGGPARTATAGGHVDIGLVGAEGFLPLRDQIRPLLLFSDDVIPGFEGTLTAPQYAAATGVEMEFIDGSQRGWAVHAALRNRYPERYLLLERAIERATRDPDCIRVLERQMLSADWHGAERSNEFYRKTYEAMRMHIDLLRG